MVIFTDRRYATVNFGIGKLEAALRGRGEFVVRKPLCEFTGSASCPCVVISTADMKVRAPAGKLENGGFEIAREGNVLYLTGGDHAGAMYGLLDLAETAALYGPDAIAEKLENPFLPLRGIKFNLPFEPYANGDPFLKNQETCLDPVFWEKFLDFLAENRYNCLSLWSEHPFHMMFRLDKYPDACPYCDAELKRYQDLYRFIFRRAKERGMEVFLITWNIRITPFVARALGLPEELGEMEESTNWTYEPENSLPKHSRDFVPVRQHLDVIQDYFKECIKTLVTTYVDLRGIGTNCAEEMVGNASERQDWVMQTYLEAVRQAGRDIPFIMRTNMGNGKIAKRFLDEYPSRRKYISWKYSNAHMYSHPEPQFEDLWGAWEGVDLEAVKVLFTVRNDDFHTLRWGDPDFLKKYIRGMKKPYVEGFYWGADGYVWGKDFQHFPGGHKTWEYDYEKHWHQFELLGRLGYNPELPDDIWREKYKAHYGEWGEGFRRGLAAASRIIPAVNRLFWLDYDFQWNPEGLLSRFGFKTILDFMNGKPMPGIPTLGVKEYAQKTLAGEETAGETPADIIRILRESVQTVGAEVRSLEESIPEDYLGGEVECTLLDLKAWIQLGRYYADKFTAALELHYFLLTGETARKEAAVAALRDGSSAWAELSRLWASHYMPYRMARVKQVFGWPYYQKLVDKDIALAQGVQYSKT